MAHASTHHPMASFSLRPSTATKGVRVRVTPTVTKATKGITGTQEVWATFPSQNEQRTAGGHSWSGAEVQPDGIPGHFSNITSFWDCHRLLMPCSKEHKSCCCGAEPCGTYRETQPEPVGGQKMASRAEGFDVVEAVADSGMFFARLQIMLTLNKLAEYSCKLFPFGCLIIQYAFKEHGDERRKIPLSNITILARGSTLSVFKECLGRINLHKKKEH